MKLLDFYLSLISIAGSRLSTLPVQIFFILMMGASYRIEISRIFTGIYGPPPEGQSLYGASAAAGDLLYLAFFAGLYTVTAMIIKPAKIFRWWIPITVFIAGGYLFSLGYFHIFEKAADPAMFGSGLGTFWKEILNSTLYEIRGRTVISIAAVTLSATTFFLSRRFFSRQIIHLAAALILPLLTIIFPPADHRETEGRIVHAADWTTAAEALGPNPVMNIIKAPFASDAGSAGRSGPDPNAGKSHEDIGLLSLYNSGEISALRIPPGNYNVIFYFFESTAASYIGGRVDEKSITPVWDRLSEKSVVFENHYAGYPLSVNALFNVFSSAHTPPKKKWVPMLNPKFGVRAVTELFKEGGYRTAVLHSGDLNNFEHKRYLTNRGIDLMLDIKNIDRQNYKTITPYSLDDRVMFKPSIKFIKEGKGPFFIAYFPLLPHHPYTFPFKEYYVHSDKKINAEPSAKKRAWMRYQNSLHFSDHCLGELYSALEESGVLENTLLFVFADHGEAFYRHPGNYLHSLYLYEDNVRVPFIIHNPVLFPEQKVYQGVSSHVDIAPTALAAAGIGPPPEYTGVPLLSRHRARAAYFHTDWETDYSGMRDGKWKFILRMDTGRGQLFDLERDPEETVNLAGEYPDIAASFTERIKAQREAAEKYFLKHKR